MKHVTAHYKGFPYPANDLGKYAINRRLFTISLKDESIVYFAPENVKDFIAWLSGNHVEVTAKRNQETRSLA